MNFTWHSDVVQRCGYRFFNKTESVALFTKKQLLMVGDSLVLETWNAAGDAATKHWKPPTEKNHGELHKHRGTSGAHIDLQRARFMELLVSVSPHLPACILSFANSFART
jgi:hypothetical protein